MHVRWLRSRATREQTGEAYAASVQRLSLEAATRTQACSLSTAFGSAVTGHEVSGKATRLGGDSETADVVCWRSIEDPSVWVRPTRGNARHFRARDGAGKQTWCGREQAGIRHVGQRKAETLADIDSV